jgi:hypothetical protein
VLAASLPYERRLMMAYIILLAIATVSAIVGNTIDSRYLYSDRQWIPDILYGISGVSMLLLACLVL